MNASVPFNNPELGRGPPNREAFGADRVGTCIVQTAHLLGQMLRLRFLGATKSWSKVDRTIRGLRMSENVPYDDFVDIYDVWCERAPITKENKTFYVELLSESRPPVIEVGVGDFNHSPFDPTAGEQACIAKKP